MQNSEFILDTSIENQIQPIASSSQTNNNTLPTDQPPKETPLSTRQTTDNRPICQPKQINFDQTEPSSFLQQPNPNVDKQLDTFSDCYLVDDIVSEQHKRLMAEKKRQEKIVDRDRIFAEGYRRVRQADERILQKWADEREDQRVAELRSYGIDAQPNYQPYMTYSNRNRRPQRQSAGYPDPEKFNEILDQLQHGAQLAEYRAADSERKRDEIRTKRAEQYASANRRRLADIDFQRQQEAAAVGAMLQKQMLGAASTPQKRQYQPDVREVQQKLKDDWSKKLNKFLENERIRKFVNNPPMPPKPPADLRYQLYKDGDCNSFFFFC